MLRALGLAMALLALGCGDDTTTTAASMDLSQPVLDLSMAGPSCGPLACTGTCAACVPLFGGVCAPPCKRSMPSTCTAPATCRPLDGGDGGASVTLTGSCAGYDGYCG
ncbi:MAG: hypothetical protein JWM53_4418 [bacterium]|nr:hypothetical protein [bacterium]